jgi:C-terminal processing protease CtpA/Prc
MRSRVISRWPARVLVLIAALVPGPARAQDAGAVPVALQQEEREAVVLRISELLEQRYVYPEVERRSGADLVARFRAGEFDDISDVAEFATRLTDALQGVSHDKHLRVRVRPAERAQLERDDPAAARERAAAMARRRNYGFERVERLEGNVGYVDMRYFDGSPVAKPTAAAAMNFIAHTDAVIFDMRRNGGGSPEMIRYVSSWFFGEPTHLNSLYFREGDRTVEFWTYDDIPGEKRPDVPVFVLTSSRTFSGAEEFSYNMLTQQRATLIGEVTGGGANPGRTFPINDRFEVFIPGGAAINPITGTNWEGVGVTPHILVSADEALDVALEKARAAAEAYRAARR